MPKIQKLICLDPELAQRFAAWCKENNISQSAQIQTLVKQHLDKHQHSAFDEYKRKAQAHRNQLIAKHGMQKAIEILLEESQSVPLE